jgi:hypothetical protein
MSSALALEYRKSCSQIPGLKEAQLRAASTGKANKVTQDLIRITGESSKRVTTDTLEDEVNRQPFGAARPLRLNANPAERELRLFSDSDVCVDCNSDERQDNV